MFLPAPAHQLIVIAGMIYLPWLFDGSLVVVTVAVSCAAWAIFDKDIVFRASWHQLGREAPIVTMLCPSLGKLTVSLKNTWERAQYPLNSLGKRQYPLNSKNRIKFYSLYYI